MYKSTSLFNEVDRPFKSFLSTCEILFKDPFSSPPSSSRPPLLLKGKHLMERLTSEVKKLVLKQKCGCGSGDPGEGDHISFLLLFRASIIDAAAAAAATKKASKAASNTDFSLLLQQQQE
jgi:hypothetical protein